jgi:hypothetical protein
VRQEFTYRIPVPAFAALMLLASASAAGVTIAPECGNHLETRENEFQLEARALAELGVARLEHSELVVQCADEQVTITLAVPNGSVRTTTVPSDKGTAFVDLVLEAIWRLTHPDPSASIGRPPDHELATASVPPARQTRSVGVSLSLGAIASAWPNSGLLGAGPVLGAGAVLSERWRIRLLFDYRLPVVPNDELLIRAADAEVALEALIAPPLRLSAGVLTGWFWAEPRDGAVHPGSRSSPLLGARVGPSAVFAQGSLGAEVRPSLEILGYRARTRVDGEDTTSLPWVSGTLLLLVTAGSP